VARTRARVGADPRQLDLFAPGVLRVTPSAESRLRRMAAAPPRTATPREARDDESRETMLRLREWGKDLARRFRLRYHELQAEQDGVNSHYGICYEDGVIRIRLRHAVTGHLLKESSLVDTLCHELAHLRHFDHSPRFWSYYRKILAEARSLGYYRPGPDPAEPKQGCLFELLADGGGIHHGDGIE
jgi:hypothetical protein